MPYTAEIGRRNPTAYLFMIDQSGSMSDGWGDGMTLSKATADAINKILSELVTKCSKEEGIRNYFEVGVIGYGWQCQDGLSHIPGGLLKPIELLEQQPRRVEQRTRKIPDGAGGLVELEVTFPVWFDPEASGSTPMCEAFRMAGAAIGTWADQHPNAFPPAIINITDGEPTDGDPEEVTNVIRQMGTSDGNVLIFNLHVANQNGAKVLYPETESQAPTEAARKLWRMSSELPTSFHQAASGLGYSLQPGAKGYGFNADFVDLVSFLNIGTQAANTRVAR